MNIPPRCGSAHGDDRQVLIVVHQAHSTPGKIGEFLRHRGFSLDRRCPSVGDTLPNDLSPYAAVIVFGGPQSANDDNDSAIRSELTWLEKSAIVSDVPLLGICLGAQQIARVLGANVGPHPEGLVEIGYWPVSPTVDAGCFLERPTIFYQWHSETFEIPVGAQHLAQNDTFSGQAFVYDDSVYGIEFHPEITREMIQRWCSSEKGSVKLSLNGAQSHAQQLAGYDQHHAASDQWLNKFIDRHLLLDSLSGDLVE